MMKIKEMSIEELLLYRETVKAYGTSMDLEEVDELIRKKEEQEKKYNGHNYSDHNRRIN